MIANHGSRIRHEEAAASLKGKHTQACVEICNTGTLRQFMHLDRETSGLIGIRDPCGYTCAWLPRCTGPLLCPGHSMVGLRKEHYHAMFRAFHVKRLATLRSGGRVS